MKGYKEHKQYVSRYRKELKGIHWDDLEIFKFERCKKWFNRAKNKQEFNAELKSL